MSGGSAQGESRVPDLDVDVLVVGAGPVGLSAALLLDRLGLRVAIIDKRNGPQRAPAAHVVNARTFEVWRQMGLDLERMLAQALNPADAGEVHWVTRLGAEPIGSLPFERQGDEVLSLTPTPLRNLSQHRLEPLLVDELTAVDVPVRYGHVWQSSEQDGAGVTSVVSSPVAEQRVRSRWVLACDGAGSPIRRSLGIEPVGPHRLQSFVMVHLAADFRALVGDHPGVMFWVCDPAVGGTFVAHDLDREWVYMLPFDPEVEDPATFTATRCAELVRRAITEPDVEFEVLTVSTWAMTAQVAPRYREGRIFLAGDAAHRFPPTGGLGLNTGVQDVHNLAWKLATVDRGEAGDALLDSYERERLPVAQHNAAASLENAFKLVEVSVALGADPDGDVAVGHANMVATLADPAAREAVGAAIADQAPHFDMLGLQLGYAYDLGDTEPAAQAQPAEASVRTYSPSAEPGGRLPHAWVTTDGERASTLDLVALDRFTLLTSSAAWAAAGAELERAGVPLRVVLFGRDAADPGTWERLADVPSSGAVLVRPDQHVAWRVRALAPDPVGAVWRAWSRSLEGAEIRTDLVAQQ